MASGIGKALLKGLGKAASRMGIAGSKVATEDLSKAMAMDAAKVGAKDVDTVLAEGLGVEAKVGAEAGMSTFEAGMKDAAKLGAKDSAAAAAKATGKAAAKDAGAAMKEAEEIAAKKSSSLAGKAGKMAKKAALPGLGAAAAGIASLVGVVMAGNTANDVVDKGEEAAGEVRNGIIDLIDPLLNKPLSAMGWSDEKIKSVEKAVANATMFGGVIVTVYMLHKAL
jgi:hypothetical protein